MASRIVLFGMIALSFCGNATANESGVGRYHADGPYTVTTATLTVPSPNGAFVAIAYIPNDARRHPVVILSSGFMQMGVAYAPYARRLASWGIVTVLRDDPSLAEALKASKSGQPGDLSRMDPAAIAETTVKTVSDVSYEVSTWLPAANADANSPLHGMIDASRIGLAGHSRGAQIALLAGEEAPGRIKGVFGLDPVDSPFAASKAGAKLASIGIPVAFIGETVNSGKSSCAPAGQNYQTLYDAATSPVVAITAINADHTMFEDPANCLFCRFFCERGTANPSAVLGYSVRYLTAFFARELLGDASVGRAFEGAGVAADVAAGTIQIVSK